MKTMQQIYCLIWKDVLLEIRRRENLLSMFFFGTVLLFIFHFSFEMPPEQTMEMAPGLLWLAFVFTGTLSLTQLFHVEKENQCLEALLLCPMDRGAFYLSKVLFNLILMVLVEIVVFPLFAILFNADIWTQFPSLLSIVVLGTIGFCALGALFSGLTLRARAKELLLPLILFPLIIPAILGTIRGMQIVLGARDMQELWPWINMLIAFDVIFLTVGFLIFEWVIES
ncbi:MAG: ABC transporter permease [Deltaproteobacteria bacterium]|nr:ABC transporter permease [Deltaproteobacteria bacterium]